MKKRNLLILSCFNLLMILLALAVFNPNLEIWGWTHSEYSGAMSITIVANDLSTILKQSYYSGAFKALCVGSVVFESILAELCAISVVLYFFKSVNIKAHFIFNIIIATLLLIFSGLLIGVFRNTIMKYSIILLAVAVIEIGIFALQGIISKKRFNQVCEA